MSSAETKKAVPTVPMVDCDRLHRLTALFAEQFATPPSFLVRVPGRVNLIGEHVDYCGYGVCPMALQQDVVVAVAPQDSPRLTLINVQPEHANFECSLYDFQINAFEDGPKWFKYFLCGVKGVLEHIPKDKSPRIGMIAAVTGNVPLSAGLSSSSALVSAAALATAQLFDLKLSKEQLANLCAECEKHIGTQGGGMDQAIAFLAEQGCAKMIEFDPLRSYDVKLPSGAVFVIAHSMVKCNKAATADFNCRVIECRLASQIIAKKFGLDWMKLRKLSDLQSALGYDLAKMQKVVKDTLHEHPYSKDEVCQVLEVSRQELEHICLAPSTYHVEEFKLRQRAEHVFSEAERVRLFYDECLSSAGASPQVLGELMSSSHRSLRDLYECSHPSLDRLVELAKGHALGARLTGAGWGGCAVALLQPHKVEGFMRCLQEDYYAPMGLAREQVGDLLFVTTPTAGACVYSLP